jgi:hypothetical protein
LFSIENQRELVLNIPEYCPRVKPGICDYEDWVRYSECAKSLLKNIPFEYRTELVCLNCIKRESYSFLYVDKGQLSREFTLKAIHVNFRVYIRLDRKDKNEEFTLAFLNVLEMLGEDAAQDVWVDEIPPEQYTNEVEVRVRKLKSKHT